MAIELVYNAHIKINPQEEGNFFDLHYKVKSKTQEGEEEMIEKVESINTYILFSSELALSETEHMVNDCLYGQTSGWAYPFKKEIVKLDDGTEILMLNGQDVVSLVDGINYVVGHLFKVFHGTYNRQSKL